MTKEEINNIWRSSDLPEMVQKRIIGEIDMLMYDDDPVDLMDNAANVRRLLYDLRYLSVLCQREVNDLIAYTEDTVATRLHQLKGPRLEIPAENRCVCCGEVIPEGRQICPICDKEKTDD